MIMEAEGAGMIFSKTTRAGREGNIIVGKEPPGGASFDRGRNQPSRMILLGETMGVSLVGMTVKVWLTARAMPHAFLTAAPLLPPQNTSGKPGHDPGPEPTAAY
jgi:hypothetical protein